MVPPLYEFRVRSRIFRWYRQLRGIEERTGLPSPTAGATAARTRRRWTPGRARSVPLSHTDELYALRSHIDLVRSKLRAARQGEGQ
jgi:hypothetical protein